MPKLRLKNVAPTYQYPFAKDRDHQEKHDNEFESTSTCRSIIDEFLMSGFFMKYLTYNKVVNVDCQ